MAEVRTTSATGGQKGTKLARFDLIPIGPLTQLAEHFGRGARKYADHQWRQGYEWSKSYSAGMRHFTAFWDGYDYDVCSNDPDGCSLVTNDGEPFEPSEPDTCYNHTGSHHLVAAAWHCFAGLEFYDKFPEHDDRYKAPPPKPTTDFWGDTVEPFLKVAPVDERIKGTALERIRYWADRLERELEYAENDPMPSHDPDWDFEMDTDELEKATKDLVEHGPDWVAPPRVLGSEWTDVGFTIPDFRAYQDVIDKEVRKLAEVTVTPFDLLTSPLTMSVELTDVSPETIALATGADLSDTEIDEGDPSTLSWREAMRRCLNDLFNRRP